MPIVSTSLGVENLDVEPGRHLLVADSAKEMIAAVSRLLADPALPVSLGREAARAAEPHRWSRVETLLEPIYREVMRTPADGGTRVQAIPSEWGREAEAHRLRAERAALAGGFLSRGWHTGGRHVRRLAASFLGNRRGLAAARGIAWLLAPSTSTGIGTRARRALARLVARLFRTWQRLTRGSAPNDLSPRGKAT
jgi:hypothetical protein